jgi:hypothetical protein
MALLIKLQLVFQGCIGNSLDLVVNRRINLDVATQELVNSYVGAEAGAELFELIENVLHRCGRIDPARDMNGQINWGVLAT